MQEDSTETRDTRPDADTGRSIIPDRDLTLDSDRYWTVATTGQDTNTGKIPTLEGVMILKGNTRTGCLPMLDGASTE